MTLRSLLVLGATLAALCLSPQITSAKSASAKIAGLERRYQQRIKRHEQRLAHLDKVIAAYDPSDIFARVEAVNAAHEARHEARVARGEAMALAADGKKVTIPGVSQAPRR
ncbi:MAG: hypothetical protein ACOY4F_04535 [Thermodesulfobacteriota bacterium]